MLLEPNERYRIEMGDCVAGLQGLPKDSLHQVVTSIPFGDLFTYSGKNEDIGNNTDGVDMRASMFGLHMRFFTEALFHAMMPGRVVSIHIQQLVRYKNKHGNMGRRDFRGAVVDLFEGAGFEWRGEVVIPKNPQIIAKRQNLHSLMFVTGKKDACQLAPAVNDYGMVFVKPGDNPEPVRALYDPRMNKGGWVTTEDWIKWASGLWDDIQETDVLTGWMGAREEGDEKHVCPLQLEFIRRMVMLYSNPGDVVCDPFMGIGSTAWMALGAPSPVTGLSVGEPRRAFGFELKESYHAQAVRNAGKAIGVGRKQGTLDLEAA